MKRSFLEEQFKGLELEDDKKKSIIDAIMKVNGDDINAEKVKTENAQNELKVKEGVIEELNKKIKEFDSVDLEKIKKEQFELGKEEGSKEFENFKKTSALKSALSEYKAKDVELLQKMLDNEKLEFEEKDGKYNIKGLEDQVKDIKKSHEYLFEVEDANKKTVDLGGQHQGTVDTSPKTLVGALREKYNK